MLRLLRGEDLVKSPASQVCVVTVTYGDRFHFLREVVEAAGREGVGRVIIVDNASPAASADRIADLEAGSGGRILRIRSERNSGSAGGYSAGLARALAATDCEFLWLLDDDNRPELGALASLLEAYARLSPGGPSERLALLCLRPDRSHLAALAGGQTVERVFPRRSSFLGFHILDLPRKLRKVFTGAVAAPTPSTPNGFSRLPFAPYGGLFLHRSAVEAIGYPDGAFYVYGDDTEYTYRLTARGGAIYLVPASRLTDLETSWWIVKAADQHPFSLYLRAGSDLQVYYSIRNSVYFDARRWALNPLTLAVNKWLILAILCVYGAWWRRWDRLRLIIQAVRDGELGRLGIDCRLDTHPRPGRPPDQPGGGRRERARGPGNRGST